MSKLLKCPFCGGEAEIGHTKHHDKLFVVGCNTPMCYGNINHFTMGFASKESALNTWNTRAPMDNIVEKLKENSFDMSLENPDCKAIWTDKAINIVKQDINNGLE